MDFIKGAVAAAGDAITALMQQYDTPEWLVSQYLDVANPLPDLGEHSMLSTVAATCLHLQHGPLSHPSSPSGRDA